MVTEKELVDALNKALEPITKAHQDYFIVVMDTVKDAFELGLEIGKKLE